MFGRKLLLGLLCLLSTSGARAEVLTGPQGLAYLKQVIERYGNYRYCDIKAELQKVGPLEGLLKEEAPVLRIEVNYQNCLAHPNLRKEVVLGDVNVQFARGNVYDFDDNLVNGKDLKIVEKIQAGDSLVLVHDGKSITRFDLDVFGEGRDFIQINCKQPSTRGCN